MAEQANNEELLNLGIQSAKRGNKDAARNLLRQVWQRDRRNERAMMWLAKIARNEKERREWLERVISINPDNETARNAIKGIEHKSASRENLTLILFGGVAAVMIIVVIAVVLVIALT